MLEIKNLSKSYLDKKVIKNISLQIDDNEIVSVVGSNGCGKTTLFKIIANLINPDNGSVSFHDVATD